ncbi:MAG: ABC transporter permease subunit [Desulfonatronovibrionaceae bacterium]
MSEFMKSRGWLILLLFFLFCPVLAAKAQTEQDKLLKAQEALALGDISRAEEIFLSIQPPADPEKADGSFVDSRLILARLYFSQEKYERAGELCREVLEVFPHNAEAANFAAAVDRELKPFYVRFFEDVVNFLPLLLKGSLMTLVLVFFTMLVSPVGGLLVALGRINGFAPLSVSCWFFIWLFRGTPLLLQLFFIYYGLPALGVTLSPISAALLGLGLNYSAYLAEIIRGGIQSIDHGQHEAAKALGMTYVQTMRRVIIPQTYKRLMPPIGNEFIALIKDTALVSTIAMVELMRAADQLFNTYFNVTVLFLAACIYLFFTTVFTLVFDRIEQKVGAYENR